MTLRLRVFDISQGPKSAVSVPISVASPLSESYAHIQTALGLSAPLDHVTLHTVRDRHVDRAPLRIDFTPTELGLVDHSIVVLRHRRAAETKPEALPAPASRSQPDPLEAFLTPRRPAPTEAGAAPATAALPPRPAPRTDLPPKVVAPPLPTPARAPVPAAAERTGMRALHEAEAAVQHAMAQQTEWEHTVQQVCREQQRTREQLRDLARATLAMRSEKEARLSQRYRAASTWLCQVPCTPPPPCTVPPWHTRLRALHQEVLAQALQVAGNRCTTAPALLDTFFDADETLESVYAALALSYPSLSSHPRDTLLHFLHREAPFLLKAAPLIQYLYAEHTAEFADHVLGTLHGLQPCPETWLFATDTSTWYSALSRLSQSVPPTWLLGDVACASIADVELAPPPTPPSLQCRRLGLQNAAAPHSTILTTTGAASSASLAVLYAASHAVRCRGAGASAELTASLVASVRDNLLYLESLCASNQLA